MTAVLNGVRVVEVAEHGFVPAAGALLSDWGAEVIKIEPTVRGDAARGLVSAGPMDVHVLFQSANRGKKSLALDLSEEAGREILYRIVATADVFLTNKLSKVRERLRIDVEQIRAHNPNIVYVRGSGQGERGEQADRGSYDLLSFWHRTGTSVATRSRDGEIPFLPAPGFGDFTGSMYIAGGVMGALFHRGRTGEAPVVDVSLLATGMWSMGGAIAVAAIDDTWNWPPRLRNPLSAIYRTKDDRWLAFSCLQAAHYWALLAPVIGRPELATDPRFSDHQAMFANSADASAILTEVFLERTLDQWSAALADFSGQWVPVQDVKDVLHDPQALANDYLQTCHTDSGRPFTLVSAPVQFDGQAASSSRAPGFNEHGDSILTGLGIAWDHIVDLKVRGVVA
ncbi:CoA transferase [Frankia sp. CNm7]|uniref:CoA transferase n=1 Tax=Frankia nepalensis TaxID=1836974 RepID=A0A937UT50_9ACTN|nr:CoA transferase [Frankia nepalensis]MBL7500998.1 CoA transferase [Frankia nepalensis]MBL7512456.1 CoA transferase [Frankia nepalensis]MBL7521521.1 CoA transferase [Frankia nepalensis]MBL7632758.1 CoA transferase [Frankia nepalensis]